MKPYQIIGLLFALAFTSCVTQEKCWKKFPPATSDSINIRQEVKDTSTVFTADSSMSKYLIECEKTAQGYKARITQMLSQQQGDYMQTPVSTIDNGNILTTTAFTPSREIHWQIRRFYFSAVKTQVYVKITNILLWWQKTLMYLGGISSMLIVLYLFIKVIKFKSKIPTL